MGEKGGKGKDNGKKQRKKTGWKGKCCGQGKETRGVEGEREW